MCWRVTAVGSEMVRRWQGEYPALKWQLCVPVGLARAYRPGRESCGQGRGVCSEGMVELLGNSCRKGIMEMLSGTNSIPKQGMEVCVQVGLACSVVQALFGACWVLSARSSRMIQPCYPDLGTLSLCSCGVCAVGSPTSAPAAALPLCLPTPQTPWGPSPASGIFQAPATSHTCFCFQSPVLLKDMKRLFWGELEKPGPPWSETILFGLFCFNRKLKELEKLQRGNSLRVFCLLWGFFPLSKMA